MRISFAPFPVTSRLCSLVLRNIRISFVGSPLHLDFVHLFSVISGFRSLVRRNIRIFVHSFSVTSGFRSLVLRNIWILCAPFSMTSGFRLLRFPSHLEFRLLILRNIWSFVCSFSVTSRVSFAPFLVISAAVGLLFKSSRLGQQCSEFSRGTECTVGNQIRVDRGLGRTCRLHPESKRQ